MKNRYTVVTRNGRKVRIARKNAKLNLATGFIGSSWKHFKCRTVSMSDTIAYLKSCKGFYRMDRYSFRCNVAAKCGTIPLSRKLP